MRRAGLALILSRPQDGQLFLVLQMESHVWRKRALPSHSGHLTADQWQGQGQFLNSYPGGEFTCAHHQSCHKGQFCCADQGRYREHSQELSLENGSARSPELMTLWAIFPTARDGWRVSIITLGQTYGKVSSPMFTRWDRLTTAQLLELATLCFLGKVQGPLS